MIKTNELENNKSKPSFNHKHDIMNDLCNVYVVKKHGKCGKGYQEDIMKHVILAAQ